MCWRRSRRARVARHDSVHLTLHAALYNAAAASLVAVHASLYPVKTFRGPDVEEQVAQMRAGSPADAPWPGQLKD